MSQTIKKSSFSPMPPLEISSIPSVTLSSEANFQPLQNASLSISSAYEGDKMIKGMLTQAGESQITAMQLSLEGTNAGNSFRLTFAHL